MDDSRGTALVLLSAVNPHVKGMANPIVLRCAFPWRGPPPAVYGAAHEGGLRGVCFRKAEASMRGWGERDSLQRAAPPVRSHGYRALLDTNVRRWRPSLGRRCLQVNDKNV